MLEDSSNHHTPPNLKLSKPREWVKCVTRTRVRVACWENACSSKINALKALNWLDKRLTTSNKLKKYADYIKLEI